MSSLPFNPENLSANERLIFYSIKTAVKEEIEKYFGQNGEQHKLDHTEIIPMLKERFDTQIEELKNKNIFWEGIKKDIYKFLLKVSVVLVIGIILVSLGITSWPKLIGLITS